LIQEEEKAPLRYSFSPFDWGPLSFELLDDMGSLISQGIVTESISELPAMSGVIERHDYELSPWGKKYASEVIEKSLSGSVKGKVLGIVNKWNSRKLQDLLDYVHKKYPKYRVAFARPIPPEDF